MKDEERYIEIDLIQLLSVLWRKIWIIILCAVIGAAAVFSYTYFFVTPLYQATAMLYINNSKGTVSSETITQSDLTASQSLVDTYVALLNSQTLTDRVIEKSGADRSAAELKSMLSASAVNETEMLKIVITSADPKEAAELANTFVRESSAMMMETVDNSSVKVVDYAAIPQSPSSPNTMKNTAMGMMLGVLLSIAAIILKELTDTVIRTENQLSELFADIPVLGVIPSMKQDDKAAAAGSYGYTSQQGSNIRNALQSEDARDKAKPSAGSKPDREKGKSGSRKSDKASERFQGGHGGKMDAAVKETIDEDVKSAQSEEEENPVKGGGSGQ